MSNGYVLDTSVLIRFERSRIASIEMLALLRESFGDAAFAISTITAMELTHGIARAETETQRKRRTIFAEELYHSVEVKEVTLPIAADAGSIRGTMAHRGHVIASEDLLIDVTALHLGYAVLTHNRRHFEMIPGLQVVTPEPIS